MKNCNDDPVNQSKLLDEVSFLFDNWRSVPVINTKLLMDTFPFVLPPAEHWSKLLENVREEAHCNNTKSNTFQECYDIDDKEAAEWYSDEWESSSEISDSDSEYSLCESEDFDCDISSGSGSGSGVGCDSSSGAGSGAGSGSGSGVGIDSSLGSGTGSYNYDPTVFNSDSCGCN